MSFERILGPGVEPAPPTASPAADGDLPAASIPASVKLQILATEHWSLLATRGMHWNEAFSRAGTFLSVLSGAIVALALVAQATAFGEGFTLFALFLLPVVLFIGVGTIIRIGQVNNEDVRLVLGMNRIRRAYVEMAPELEARFVTGVTDDEAGVLLTYGADGAAVPLVEVLASTPGMLMVVNAVVAAVLGALVALTLNLGTTVAVIVGIACFVLFIGAISWYGYREFQRGRAALEARYGPGAKGRFAGTPQDG